MFAEPGAQHVGTLQRSEGHAQGALVRRGKSKPCHWTADRSAFCCSLLVLSSFNQLLQGSSAFLKHTNCVSRSCPSHQPLVWGGGHLGTRWLVPPLFPTASELLSNLEASRGGVSSAGVDIRFCSGPAKAQALRVSCQAAGRGLGIDLVDWKFTHLPPD